MTIRTFARLGALTGAGALVALLGAVPASAHVRADPTSATGGAYSVITLRVPDESDTAGTVGLTVTLPTDHPISSVSTEPMPGWTARVDKVALPAPVPVGHEGATTSEAVRSVTWTAAPGTRIGPNEFAQFRMQAGPLPDGPGTLVMPANQTYDDGKVVSWSETQAPGAPEPEHPAPTVTLLAATAPAPAAPADATSRWLGGIGLVLGALGAVLGGAAFARTRARPSAPAEQREEVSA